MNKFFFSSVPFAHAAPFFEQNIIFCINLFFSDEFFLCFSRKKIGGDFRAALFRISIRAPIIAPLISSPNVFFAKISF